MNKSKKNLLLLDKSKAKLVSGAGSCCGFKDLTDLMVRSGGDGNGDLPEKKSN